MRRTVEAERLKPLTEILAGIQATYPGKMLDIDFERDRSGQRVYEMIILKATGQRVKVLVDAIRGDVDLGRVEYAGLQVTLHLPA